MQAVMNIYLLIPCQHRQSSSYFGRLKHCNTETVCFLCYGPGPARAVLQKCKVSYCWWAEAEVQKARLVGPSAPLTELEARGSRGQGATHSHAIPMWIQAEYAENPAFLEKATAESLPSVIQ